jgi:pimeloyl-ACP methyl ester carboxylesterase
VTADAAEILVDGPWRHRFVAANGGRFHVAEAGTGPLVLLLHGFPEFWWAWRHQLPALASAGYHAVAMDLRGYGASDKPPRGYDTPTLTADVAGVIRALGAAEAVVVGHDWGGWIAWSMPSLQPRVTRAIGVVSMAHPLAVRGRQGYLTQLRAARRILRFQLPIAPERWLGDRDGVARLLHEWSAEGCTALAPDSEASHRYTRAMQLPFVAHTAMEYYRWSVRSLLRRDGRRFTEAMREPVPVPVLQLHGGLDPLILPETAAASRRWAGDSTRYEIVPTAGHFLPEEAPDRVTDALLAWLADLPYP